MNESNEVMVMSDPVPDIPTCAKPELYGRDDRSLI
jgi:hypothetical protein